MDGFIRPQNLQDFQNGNYTDDTYGGSFSDFPNDVNWALNPINNEPITQSAASHMQGWQQPTATTPGLENYGRHFSKSPSAIQATANFGYGDPRQFNHSPYDPSLGQSSSIGDPTSTYVDHSSYGQQSMQHGTIAPQALQHGQTQFSRSMGNLDNQVR